MTENQTRPLMSSNDAFHIAKAVITRYAEIPELVELCSDIIFDLDDAFLENRWKIQPKDRVEYWKKRFSK